MKIRLTEWAARQGVARVTAVRWAKAGKVPGLTRTPANRLMVEVDVAPNKKVVLYGRVSSADQRADLDRQMQRLRDFAAAQGLPVSDEVAETGSGLNGRRKGLLRLLRDASVSVLVVEHRDRLARFGVEYMEALLSAQGRSLVVVNETEQKLDLVQDFIDVVTSMCSRIYGGRSATNRAKRAIAAAQEAE